MTFEQKQARAVVRFSQRYTVNENGCWIWDHLQANGYSGQFGPERARSAGNAYRWAYEHFVGPIPDGMTLDHVCHTNSDCVGGTSCPHRACVNPAHLEPTTRGENTLRGNSPLAMKARQTHCIHGHELEPPRQSGKRLRRRCRVCAVERKRAAYRRKRDAA